MINDIQSAQAESLKGRYLEMVCFNANQVYFHFSGNSHIVLEARYCFWSKAITAPQIVSAPSLPMDVIAVMDKGVLEYELRPSGTLRLVFENGYYFEAYKEDGYESYKVVIDGRELVSV